jgi:NAD(P)-dependent dehydrogenase (short-subunit alcohol dehydrogenase family)
LAIIQTTPEQAYDTSENLVDYAITKAAGMNFTKPMAKQLGPKGIRVNGVAPGPIWTPLQVSGGATMEKLVKFGGDTPLGRPGQPAELASIYVSSQIHRRATPPGRFMERPAVAVSRSAQLPCRRQSGSHA